MKEQGMWRLSLFGADHMGEETAPAITQQASGEEEAAPVAGAQSEAAKKEAFKNMMEGEYKELFQSFFQETFNRRFKEQKSMMEELKRARDVVDAVAGRYGTRDETALCAAIRAETEKTAPTAAATVQEITKPPAAASPSPERDVEAVVKEAVEQARRETERAVTEAIRARGLRPTESAMAPGVGALTGRGVSRLTRSDRAEMARRAARGEHIEF